MVNSFKTQLINSPILGIRKLRLREDPRSHGQRRQRTETTVMLMADNTERTLCARNLTSHLVRQEHHRGCSLEETEIPRLRREVLSSVQSTSLLFMNSYSNGERKQPSECSSRQSFPSPHPQVQRQSLRAAPPCSRRRYRSSCATCYSTPAAGWRQVRKDFRRKRWRVSETLV